MAAAPRAVGTAQDPCPKFKATVGLSPC